MQWYHLYIATKVNKNAKLIENYSKYHM